MKSSKVWIGPKYRRVLHLQEDEWELSFIPVLYVDDILLIGNDVQMLNNVKEYFSMKDMGEAAYVLGIKIYRD
jgi:hypothetical protein